MRGNEWSVIRAWTIGLDYVEPGQKAKKEVTRGYYGSQVWVAGERIAIWMFLSFRRLDTMNPNNGPMI